MLEYIVVANGARGARGPGQRHGMRKSHYYRCPKSVIVFGEFEGRADDRRDAPM